MNERSGPGLTVSTDEPQLGVAKTFRIIDNDNSFVMMVRLRLSKTTHHRMTYEKHKTCIFSRSFSKEALREAYRIASRCCELSFVVIIFRVFVARVQVKAGIFSARTRHRLTVLLRHVTTA